LVERLLASFKPLSSFVDQFVGLQTSADDVFILDLLGLEGRSGVFRSKALGQEVKLELDLLHPLVSGTDVKRYRKLARRQFILFPYVVTDERAELLEWQEIAASFPMIASYLETNKKRLAGREHSKFDDRKWYSFGRSQNLGIQERPKLCVPRLVERLNATADSTGDFYLDNVDVGGLTLKAESQGKLESDFLLTIINSRLMGWLFPHISAPFRGGWYSANRQFLSKLPIAEASPTVRKQLCDLASQMVESVERSVAATRDSEREQLQRKCEYLDEQIDRLVYELYGLTEEEIRIVEGRDN
jgi:hypothetical protein